MVRGGRGEGRRRENEICRLLISSVGSRAGIRWSAIVSQSHGGSSLIRGDSLELMAGRERCGVSLSQGEQVCSDREFECSNVVATFQDGNDATLAGGGIGNFFDDAGELNVIGESQHGSTGGIIDVSVKSRAEKDELGLVVHQKLFASACKEFNELLSSGAGRVSDVDDSLGALVSFGFGGLREWVDVAGVEGDEENVWILFNDLSRSIALMNVEIEDCNLLQVVLIDGVEGTDGDRVEDAVAVRRSSIMTVSTSVVTRGADTAKDVANLTVVGSTGFDGR